MFRSTSGRNNPSPSDNLGRRNKLPNVTLSVLCRVEQQTQDSGWQLGSTDKSRVMESGFWSCAKLAKRALDGPAPVG
jgi:hypothetical protein